jgi:single-strand DNA-binding protein
VAWAALGERAAKHLRKGRNVLVEGRLQTRVWADARGNKHITAEIRADRILFLGRGGASGDTIARDEDNDGRARQLGAEARS